MSSLGLQITLLLQSKHSVNDRSQTITLVGKVLLATFLPHSGNLFLGDLVVLPEEMSVIKTLQIRL